MSTAVRRLGAFLLSDVNLAMTLLGVSTPVYCISMSEDMLSFLLIAKPPDCVDASFLNSEDLNT